MDFTHNFSDTAMKPNQIVLLTNTADAVAKMPLPLTESDEWMALYTKVHKAFEYHLLGGDGLHDDEGCAALLERLDAGFESPDRLRIFRNLTRTPRRLNEHARSQAASR